MKRLVPFLSLFTSFSTLICCALPALFVVLGFGATLAGLVSNVPQLVWISENKIFFFIFGAAMLSIGGFLQWKARKMVCPIDKKEDCTTTRDWSSSIYIISLILYLVGAGFAFIAPLVTK